MAELLLWLRASGWTFQQRSAVSTADRLRALVHGDLEADWFGARVAAALDMSRATLHRRLAIDGTTVARLVQESRLLAAMQLLQATDETVTSIGFACGFATSSSFARQFRRRFGLAPSHVRTDEMPVETQD